mmetsp:Transcript_13287/g.17745  ORF Transcript_13287/g.17745 Transcript_13287/m.17745 type:complete len:242 (+) Transcript_13287:14-739(+)
MSERPLSVAVYASARNGNNEMYLEAANHFGRRLAELGIRLVNGGGRTGGMGAVNRGCKDAGGHIICVIHERFVVDGVEFEYADQMIVSTGPNLGDRKRLLAEHADIIVALPGGIGTFDELFEAAALSQLNFTGAKPVAILNIDNYYSGLLQQLERAHSDGLLSKLPKDIIFPATSVDDLIQFCLNHEKSMNGAPRAADTDSNGILLRRRRPKIQTFPSFLFAAGLITGCLLASFRSSFFYR